MPKPDDIDALNEISKRVESQDLSFRETRRLIRRRREQVQGSHSYYSNQKLRSKVAVRAINQCIVSLKLALVRLDDAIESVSSDWFAKEALFQYRISLHDEIDSLIKLKNKIMRNVLSDL